MTAGIVFLVCLAYLAAVVKLVRFLCNLIPREDET